MAAKPHDKVIQVQKPAQSLEHFQRSLGSDSVSPALRNTLVGLGVAAVAGLAWLGWSSNRSRQVERFEDSVAALRIQVEGDGVTPLPPAEVEKRMREGLPRLEALAKDAPGPSRAGVEGLVQTWKLALDGKGGGASQPGAEAWGRLHAAQRAIALGQAKPAQEVLAPLRARAGAKEPWGEAYWATVLQSDQLAGDRAQAVKDLAEYKQRFAKEGASPQMDAILKSL